jgi:DNA helicase-4
MPRREQYPYAEERRLFYVAMTRARIGLAVFTIAGSESEFVTEIMSKQQLTLLDIDGAPSEAPPCTKCKRGIMMVRTRKHDGKKFLGCSRFPKCDGSSPLPHESA